MTATPLILVIDTATDCCRLALCQGAQVHTFEGEAGSGKLDHMLAHIDTFLHAYQVSIRDCAAIAVGVGPGAFTGLRVGCTLAQGFALINACPILALPHLPVLAQSAWQASLAPTPPHRGYRVLCALDARLDQAYAAVYEWQGGWQPVQEPTVASAQELLDMAALWQVQAWAGNGNWLHSFVGHSPSGLVNVPPLLSVMGHMALQLFQAGTFTAPRDLAPLYVRDRVALTVTERRLARRADPA